MDRLSVSGPTFEAAMAAWRTLVETVQPLPPPEGRWEPPEPTPPPEPPVVDRSDPKKLIVSTGTIEIVMAPPFRRPWPEARPENVPAVAVPCRPRRKCRRRGRRRGSTGWCG